MPPGIILTAGGLLTGMPATYGTYTFTVSAADTDGIAGVQGYVMEVFVPTAANVSVSGRVMNSYGNGIQNAIVTITNTNGTTKTIRTGSFGYYRFDELETGNTYILSVASKRYVISPSSIVFTLTEDLANLDFIGQE